MPDPQAAPLHVSPMQLDTLQQIVRRSTSAQRLVKRSRIILLAVTGIPNTQIAKQVQVDHETVRALARPVANRRSAFAGYRSTLDRRAAFGSAFPVHLRAVHANYGYRL
jgi:DNA-binding CsgD family transcriptional regulator